MDEQFNARTGSSEGMNTGAGSGMGTGTGTAARLRDQFTEKANEAKEKVTEYGRKALDKLEAQRSNAAGALDQTASALHERSDKAVIVAHRTADRIQATADYIREHDFKAMTQDLTEIVRRYPTQSLAIAAVAGFLVARAIRSSD
jgi:ElaB/YqjD/DUF883 family membrane-anchored ribosome-binding protein